MMKIFQFKIYDPDGGEIDCGFFKTRALALKEKKRIEEETGHKLTKDEYEFFNVEVVEK